MSAVDTRNNSALFKRAEQLKRWEESDTNREPPHPKDEEDRKIKFSSGCVFLAACMSGDKEEVVRLLDTGADIDTANVDGLTALHQACIDDNLDMVEFLVQHKADINRADNEGWTPLHATASCGFVSIARYLIENGAELDLVNSDGELAIDLSASNSMENLLQKYIDERNIDCEEARKKEEKMMLSDAKKWLRSDAAEADKRHPRTGATSLHVAAAKGYTKVLSLLLAGRANVDQQDNDGWTPLHAAAHWGQKEAAQMLVSSLADMDIKNYAGQSPIDVADAEVVRFLEDMKKKKNKRRPGSQLRISDSLDINRDTPPKVIRVDVKSELKDELVTELSEDLLNEQSDDEDDYSESTDSNLSSISESVDEKPKPPVSEPSVPNENPQEEESNSWRRSARNSQQDKGAEKENQIVPDPDVILRRTHSFESDEKFYQKLEALRARIKYNSCPKIPATTTSTGISTTTSTTTTTKSGSNAKTESGVSLSNSGGPNNNGLVTNSKLNNNSSNQINCVQRSASLKDHRAFRPNAVSPPSSPVSSQQQPEQAVRRTENYGIGNDSSKTVEPPAVEEKANANDAQPNQQQLQQQQQQQSKSNSSSPSSNKLSPGNIFKNFFKSFVPPVRDEESETQRKAHAKRVRETRRSTQGVTLDEIKSAEELVKKKNLSNSENVSESSETGSKSEPDRLSTQGLGGIGDDAVDSETVTLRRSPAIGESLANSSKSSTTPEETAVSFTISSPSKRGFGIDGKLEELNSNDDIKLSATYTLPKRQSSSASASPVPFYKNYHMQNQAQSPQLSYNVKVPPKLAEDAGSHVSATLSLKDLAGNEQPAASSRQQTSPISFTKKSLFDMDNANSLTLADKLRNEANKYCEVTGSNKSLSHFDQKQPTVTDRTKREIITGSTQSLNESVMQGNSNSNNSAPSSSSATSTTTTHKQLQYAERRPSWRLKFDAGSKFKLEDAVEPAVSSSSSQSQPLAATSSNSVLRRPTSLNSASLNVSPASSSPLTSPSSTTALRPVSAPFLHHQSGDNGNETNNSRSKDGESSLANCNDNGIGRLGKAEEAYDKENDKENDNRSGSGSQATQAVIQRRRRPKRRSTGVVHVDMDDLEDRDSAADADEKESGAEDSRKSRLSSGSNTQSEAGDQRSPSTNKSLDNNGDFIDYKALYEASQAENDKLKDQLRVKDENLSNSKAALERFTNATTKNTLSDLEKRERRAMERKLSEMEEELKHLDILKQENQRLKDENGALIRVISKLSK